MMFNKSSDGINWTPVDSENPVSYVGGGSELGWSFDLQGHFWGVIRNEDGDESGWGSRVAHGFPEKPSKWHFSSEKSDPSIIESPRMFRHGNDLYLIGRTDPTGHFMNKNLFLEVLPSWLHHLHDLAAYSLRNHGNAIWKVNKDKGSLERVLDIPGCGDTSFASIIRLAKNKYLIANYSSPRDQCQDWWWIHGQISSEGTAVYFMTIEFEEMEENDTQ